MWVGNLIIGEEVIPITCLIPFVLAFILAFILSVLHHMSDRKER
ncbi:nuclease [Staphylococcus phage StAP1]|nr:nuclease [Staphylococcus phage StAP1]